MGIDTGYLTSSVYSYCRDRFDQRIWAIKGGKDDKAQIWPRRPTRNNKFHCPLYTINTSAIKDTVTAGLTGDASGPNAAHFPEHYSEEYFDMLTAEKPLIRYSRGQRRREWVQIRARNEALDCRTYAYAVLHGLYAIGFKIVAPEETPEETPEAVPPVQPRAPMVSTRPPLESPRVRSNPVVHHGSPVHRSRSPSSAMPRQRVRSNPRF